MTSESLKVFLSKNKEAIGSFLLSTAFGVLAIATLSAILGGYILNRIEEKRRNLSN